MSAPAPPPQPWQRFVAGSFSGVCLALVGHPLDLFKVRLQTGRDTSLIHAATSIFRESGLRGLYRGVAPPLALTGVINTLLWGLTFSLTDAMEARGIGGDGTTRAMLAAIPSGVLIAAVVTPVEGIKTRLQVGGGREGAIAMTRRVLAEEGVRHGLYRGLSATACARASNWAYFGGNAAVLGALGSGGTTAPPVSHALLAGGCAGIAYWLAAFPFDLLKARIMVTTCDPPPTMRAAAAELYRAAGWRGFTRGLTPTLLRAAPANAAAFSGFALAMQALQ